VREKMLLKIHDIEVQIFTWSSQMTDLRKLSGDVLEKEIKAAAADERLVITRILHFLKEIERRRIPALRGFASLDEYCVKVLKY